MKIIAKSILVLLSILIAFYVFKVFHDFYSIEVLVGGHYIPTQEGFLFLFEKLWSAAILLAVLIGSLLQKAWAWHLLLFMTVYSVLITIASLVLIAEDRLINYLKLFLYFGLISLMSSKIISKYYNIQLKKQSFYMASIVAVMVFVFYFR